MLMLNVLSFGLQCTMNTYTAQPNIHSSLYTAVTDPFYGLMSSIATSVLFRSVKYSSIAMLLLESE